MFSRSLVLLNFLNGCKIEWLRLLFLAADIRELISLDDVMEELGLGPNGGLMYCMEYPEIRIISRLFLLKYI